MKTTVFQNSNVSSPADQSSLEAQFGWCWLIFRGLCWRADWSSRDHQPTKHQNISKFSWLLTKHIFFAMVNEEALFCAIRIWEQFIFHAHWMFLHRDNNLTSSFLNSELNCQGLLSIEAFCCSGRDKANSFFATVSWKGRFKVQSLHRMICRCF